MGFLIRGCCLKSGSGGNLLWGFNLLFSCVHLLRELEDLLFLSIHDEVEEKDEEELQRRVGGLGLCR